MSKPFEAQIEDVVEFTCQIVVKDLEARVYAVRYDDKKDEWQKLDVTDFLPIEEAIRIQELCDDKRSAAMSQIARKVGLWL